MSTRVGIMSMQRIRNYGSSLQALGLRRLVESLDVGADVSFVDYRPGAPLVSSANETSGASRAVSKVRAYGSVRAPLRDKLRFFNHKRTYARRYFPLVGIPDGPNHRLDLDVQVIGSDEVFNCVQSNVNVGYARDLFGHGSPAGRIVSYAASFGNTTLDRIEEFGLGPDLEQDFARFAHISVRDRNSADVVEHVTGTRPPIHVDPVLAYDYLALEHRIPRHRLHRDPYMIVYAYPGRISPPENRALIDLARSRGIEILSFGGVQECADRFVDCSPFELLAYFRDAEAVVTDTFHGTIFAIINGTPFATLVRPTQGHGYGNEEKLGYLLESFGLDSRRIVDVADLASTLAIPFDRHAVEAALARERARSRDYLSVAVAA